MKTEPTTALLSPPLTPAQPSATEASPAVAVSPWEEYLIGKKVSADRFLTQMGKSVNTMPDDTTRHRFAEALAAKPERVSRLILLLQASVVFSDTLRCIVVEFAEAGIKRLGVVSFPEQLDAIAFHRAVSSWLTGISKKPVKPADLNILFLLLWFGRHRQCLDEETAFSLVVSACSQSVKRGRKSAQPPQPPQTALEMLLAAEPTLPVLTSLLAYKKVHTSATDTLHTQIQAQTAEITRLTTECAQLTAIPTDLHTAIATLQEEKATAEARIAELDKDIVDIRDGYQHKLDDLRGRMRGMLQGQLTRWLQTALDASRSDPPWTQAIQERLEDALYLIEKESQWLQPSA
jgi:hypothetical protein